MSSKSYKDNLEEYWESEYYTDNTKFELNNYIFDVEDATVYLLGDIEGDYTMIFQWFVDNEIIDDNLNWIAPKNIYIIQTGDQVDKYSNIYIKGEGKVQPTRRQRSNELNSFGSDLDVIIFFDYLQYASKMKYGTERVVPLIGNHEVMNFHKDLRYSIDHSSSNKFFSKEKAIIMNIMTNEGSPINNILMKRPVITRFNNLVVSHAGLNLESIKWYTRFNNKNFNIDEFIEEINKLGIETYLQDNIYYKKIVEPLLWTRDYQIENTPIGKEYEDIGENIIVLGHNSFKNVIICDENTCKDLKEFDIEDKIDTIRMIKVDTSLSSRFCKNDLSKIYLAKVEFDDLVLTNIKETFYGFNCESAKYPEISFIINERMLPYFVL